MEVDLGIIVAVAEAVGVIFIIVGVIISEEIELSSPVDCSMASVGISSIFGVVEDE